MNRATRDILIVEDEAISRRALAQLLAASGYRTEAVESGEEVLRHIAQTSPSILPVLITAADRERIDALRQRLPIRCMRKPIDVDRLLMLLSEHLSPN